MSKSFEACTPATVPAIFKPDVIKAVRDHPGITTPEIALHFLVSVSHARWLILRIDELEYYDGDHVRLKG